jgi:hypothetical protein
MFCARPPQTNEKPKRGSASANPGIWHNDLDLGASASNSRVFGQPRTVGPTLGDSAGLVAKLKAAREPPCEPWIFLNRMPVDHGLPRGAHIDWQAGRSRVMPEWLKRVDCCPSSPPSIARGSSLRDVGERRRYAHAGRAVLANPRWCHGVARSPNEKRVLAPLTSDGLATLRRRLPSVRLDGRFDHLSRLRLHKLSAAASGHRLIRAEERRTSASAPLRLACSWRRGLIISVFPVSRNGTESHQFRFPAESRGPPDPTAA